MRYFYPLQRVRLLVLLLLVLPVTWVNAQYNLTFSNNGGNPGGLNTDGDASTAGWTAITAGTQAANVWSANQTIPFTFSFWGTPVTQFKVSQNGVLTFDVATAILPGANVNIPSASFPDMSVAGMWDDFTNAPPTGSNDVVWVKTFGSAPNRQHWVLWFSFEYGNPNMSFAYNAIVLEETTNNIYVVDEYSTTSPLGTTTVGIQLNSTTGLEYTGGSPAGSPNTPHAGNGTSLADNDYWYFQYLGPPCSGMPATGTTAGPTPVCPASVNNYTVTGGTIASAITYQWQSSPDGIVWSDIVGATSSNYSTSLSNPVELRRRDVCTTTSDTAYSTPLSVAISPFMNCYCTSIPSSTLDEDIYDVTINGGSTDPLYSNANNCTTAAPGPGSILGRYSNFMTLPPISSAAPGQTVNFTIVQDECNGPTYFNNGIAMWVDFNQNGSFSDPGEQVFVEGTTTAGPRTINGSFTIPMAAATGNTVVRIICAEGFSGASLQPCMTYTYGETEDYLFDIQCPTLNGVTSLDVGVCSGNMATLNGSTSNALATISWWDSPSGGTQIGSGTSFTSGALTADTNFYVQEDFPNCPSSIRVPVSVTVTDVDVVLAPIDASCNGGDNGSFTQTSVLCGTGPYEYSVNGGAFGPIPTDLIAGTYSVVVRDVSLATSVPYQVIVNEPAAPSGGYATNVTYYNAQLGWTTTGNETSWTVIYGPAGFDPATGGTVMPGSTNPLNLTGVLSADTDYDFYVFSECGPAPDTAGPFSFSTDPGFYTYDNACGPGFIDISGSGTNLNLTDDSEAGVTLPWAWSVNGTTVNTITIGNNGGIIFNTLSGNVGYGATGTGFFPFAQDLNTPEATGGVFWESIGTAPNRQFVIQWKDLSHYTFPAVTNGVTFELIHEEATNETYFIYQDVDFANPTWDLGADAEIAANTPGGNVVISTNNTTYLTNNSCVHLYNELCPNPTGNTTLVFADDAILDWNAGLYGETNWTLIYGFAGFDPLTPGAAIDTFQLVSSDASFGNTLTQLTSYDVYIYSECQADNLTSPGLLVSFTTLPYCSNPSAFAGFTAEDVLDLAWNWTESDPAYPIDGFNISYVNGANNSAYDPNGTEVPYTVTGGDNFETVTDANLLAGGVYQVYVQAVCTTGDTSSYVGPITLVMPLSNDTVCGSEGLMVDGTVYTFNNAGATISLNEAPIAPPADGAQVTTGWANSTLNGTTWFTFQAPASGSMRINGTAINYNGQYAVYEATDCADFATFSLVAANDDAIEGGSNAPNFTVCGLTPGNTYYLMADGFNATTGNYSIALTEIDLEAGNMNPVTDICTGSNIDLFTTITGYDAGGTWTSDIAAVNASITGSDFESNGLGYQTFDFEYRVIDGCAYDTIISQVQIFGLSNAGDDGTITICKNDPFELFSGLVGTVDFNGTWYDPSDNALPGSSIDYGTLSIPGSYNYDYIAGNGVCPNDTAVVVVTVNPNCDFLSVDEEAFNGLSLYPNPSEGIVYIASDATQSFDYTVTDAEGRIVMTANNGIKAGQTSEINLEKVETGVYFIKVSNSQTEKVFRVVIQ